VSNVMAIIVISPPAQSRYSIGAPSVSPDPGAYVSPPANTSCGGSRRLHPIVSPSSGRLPRARQDGLLMRPASHATSYACPPVARRWTRHGEGVRCAGAS
jgi:hypothetical protein